VAQLGAQALAYGLFMAGIGYFSVMPSYEHLPVGQAVIKLAFSHAGEHREECTQQSAAELAKLPTNRRRLSECKRERVPVQLELTMDGRLVFSGLQPPTGLGTELCDRFPAGDRRFHLWVSIRNRPLRCWSGRNSSPPACRAWTMSTGS
jgi:hypothetical protein